MALRQAALVLAAASTACAADNLRTQTFTDCLQLPFLGKNSAVGDCPTLYSTDRDTYLVQGWKIFANGRPRAEVRQQVWRLAGQNAPDKAGEVVVDIDGVLVLAHSEKQDATATWKKTFGHHPLFAFVDHGREGSGEPVAGLLRPGNAGSNTAADHIEAARLALAQLPKTYRRGRRTLIRTDSGGGTHEFLNWLTARGRWLSYSVGMVITDAIHQAVLKVPVSAWTPAVK